MRIRTTTAAACALAAALAAGGCTSASSGQPATPSTSPAAAGPASTSPTVPPVNGSPAAPVSDAPSTAASSPAAQAAGSGGTCQAQNLNIALAGRTTTPGYPGQKRQTVDLTNTGPSGCTMAGFPGVDLIGAARGQQHYRWSLVRQVVSYSAVTLPPGGKAHFYVIYLPANAQSEDITVARMDVTPPGDFTHARVTWHKAVLLQDGATHPGTYISPVMPGS